MRGMFVLLLSLFLTAGPALGLPSRRDRWIELQTAHFTLLGNAPESTLVAMGKDLESLRAVLGQISDLNLDPPTPTRVYVFKNEKHLLPYTHRDPSGKPIRVSGAFFRSPHGNYILVNGERPERARRVVFHEYTHFFISYNFPPVPLWFEEGAAELYSTFETRGDKASIGKAVSHHLQWLRKQPWIPLERLLEVDRQAPVYHEGSRRGSFYAQSWALVHYLAYGRVDGPDRLQAFLRRLRHQPARQALAESFGVSPRELEDSLRAYVLQDVHLSQQLPIDPRHADATPAGSARRLNRLETLGFLGDLLVTQEDRRQEADEHFRAALALDERWAHAWRGLGLAAEKAGEFQSAADFYRRAAELDPDDPIIQALGLRARLQAGEDPRLVRAGLARLTRVHPGLPLAWQLRAATYGFPQLSPHEAEEGLAVFRRALQLAPENVKLAESLMRLYLWLGRSREAQELVATYFRPRGLIPPSGP